MCNIQRDQEKQVHSGQGIRPQHDVWLRLTEDDKVILRQVVYDSGGQGTYEYELGDLSESQYANLLAHTPSWVWSVGLFSNGHDKFWYKAVQWAKDGDFTPLWQDIYPDVVDDGIGDSKIIAVSEEELPYWERGAHFDDYAAAVKARVAGVPEFWPDGPGHRVRWKNAA